MPKDRSQTTTGHFPTSNGEASVTKVDKVRSMSVNDASDAPPIPTYFMFLTTMALNVFVKENVDVAVIEVGIGGEFDVPTSSAVQLLYGVTSLGLEHTAILGNTIQKIAWSKCGIFKDTVPALSVEQVPTAMNVLTRRAKEEERRMFQVLKLFRYSNVSTQILRGNVSNLEFLVPFRV